MTYVKNVLIKSMMTMQWGGTFDVKSVVTERPELDEEFCISEEMEWMRDNCVPTYGDPESKEIA
jgi:hypothetical protein